MNGLSATPLGGTPGGTPPRDGAPATKSADPGRPRRQAAMRAQASFGRNSSATPRARAARPRISAPVAQQAPASRVRSRSGLPKTPRAARRPARREQEEEEYIEGDDNFYDQDEENIDWEIDDPVDEGESSNDSNSRSSRFDLDFDPSGSSNDSESSASSAKRNHKNNPRARKGIRGTRPGSSDVAAGSKTAKGSARKYALKALKNAFPRVCQRKFANLQTFSTVARPEGWVYLAVKDRWTQEDVDGWVPRMIRETITTQGRDLRLHVLEDFLSRLRLVAETVRFYVADAENSKHGRSLIVERLLRLIRLSGYEASCVRSNLIESASSREVAQAAAREDKIHALQLSSSVRALILKEAKDNKSTKPQVNNGNGRRFGRN